MRQTAQQLAFSELRRDDAAGVIHPDQALDVRLPGLGVYGHAGNNAAVAPGFSGCGVNRVFNDGQQLAGIAPSSCRAGSLQHSAAAYGHAAAGQRAYAGRATGGVAFDHSDQRRVAAERLCGNGSVTGLVALSLRGRAAGHFNPPIRQQADTGTFPALAAGLDIHGQPDAHQFAGSASPGLLASFMGIVKTRAGLLECSAVVTGVQVFAGQRDMRHVAHQIAQAKLDRINAALAGRHLDQPLHQQGRFGASCPPVNMNRCGVGHGRLRGNVDAAHQVGPGQNARGIARRHHRAEGQPGANREIHVGLQVHKAALCIQPQLAFEPGATALCGRGEFF